MSKASPFSGRPPSARPTAALIVPPCATAMMSWPACSTLMRSIAARHAIVEIHETLAAGRGLIDCREPVAAGRPAGQKSRAMHALPFAEMLFGEMPFRAACCRLWKSRGPDRIRGLMRAFQMCWQSRPHCAAGFYRPLRTPRGRWCRSRDPSVRRCSHCLRAPARDAPTTSASPPCRVWRPPTCLYWTSPKPFNSVRCRCTSEHASSQVTSAFEILFEIP